MTKGLTFLVTILDFVIWQLFVIGALTFDIFGKCLSGESKSFRKNGS